MDVYYVCVIKGTVWEIIKSPANVVNQPTHVWCLNFVFPPQLGWGDIIFLGCLPMHPSKILVRAVPQERVAESL